MNTIYTLYLCHICTGRCIVFFAVFVSYFYCIWITCQFSFDAVATKWTQHSPQPTCCWLQTAFKCFNKCSNVCKLHLNEHNLVPSPHFVLKLHLKRNLEVSEQFITHIALKINSYMLICQLWNYMWWSLYTWTKYILTYKHTL